MTTAKWMALITLVSFLAGFMVRGWYDGSLEAEKLTTALTERNKAQEEVSAIAKEKNELQAQLDAKDRENDKVVTKIITRDVYRNVCIDDDGVSAINGDTPKS